MNKPWGGKRVGAGRPAELDLKGQKKAKHSVYCTAYELETVREFLKVIRDSNYEITATDCKKYYIKR